MAAVTLEPVMPSRKIQMRNGFAAPLAFGLLLAACGRVNGGAGAPGAGTEASRAARPGPSASERSFHSARYGFTLHYAPQLRMTRSFRRNDLGNGRWKAYAGPGSAGDPVVALVLPGSNHVTAAELRIGASRDPAAVRSCTQPPGAAQGTPSRRTVDGVPFTYFRAADAAMSHYLETRSYRAVHDGACIAIDLLVTGTRPEVYDPPATPPFTQARAFERLQRALRGFRFDR